MAARLSGGIVSRFPLFLPFLLSLTALADDATPRTAALCLQDEPHARMAAASMVEGARAPCRERRMN